VGGGLDEGNADREVTVTFRCRRGFGAEDGEVEGASHQLVPCVAGVKHVVVNAILRLPQVKALTDLSVNYLQLHRERFILSLEIGQSATLGGRSRSRGHHVEGGRY
jgi:hypothetical protein